MQLRMGIAITALCLLALGLAACTGGSDGDDPLPIPIDQNPPADTPPDSSSPSTNNDAPTNPPDGADTPADPVTGATADDPDDGIDADPDPADAAAPDGPDSAPATDDPNPPAAGRDPTNFTIRSTDFPQPDPSVTVDVIPRRPEAFADFGRAALPWLQNRTNVQSILPLFEAWRMPPIIGGFRLNLVNTRSDALAPNDGRSAIVIVYTDPPSAAIATGQSNLVVYQPLPDAPGTFRIAYDHDLVEQSFGASPGRMGLEVTSVIDATGDGLPNISFQELVCDAGGCRRLLYILSNEGDQYRRTLAP